MKQCRFCDNEIPFYGSDTCLNCLNRQIKLIETEVRLQEHLISQEPKIKQATEQEFDTIFAQFVSMRDYQYTGEKRN